MSSSPLLLFAFVKAFQDRRAPWYQRRLIRKSVALDRRDTVVGRRAPLHWRACGGTRRVTCAWLRAVDQSFLAPSRRRRVMFVLVSNVYANRMTRRRLCRRMSPETTACEIATALRNYRNF